MWCVNSKQIVNVVPIQEAVCQTCRGTEASRSQRMRKSPRSQSQVIVRNPDGPRCYHSRLFNMYKTRSKLAWAASTLGVITLGFSMFALVAIAKGDEKFQKEVKS